MQLNEAVFTPRFCTVRINAIFKDPEEAKQCGYNEPTYYESEDYDIQGKYIGRNRMKFAAIRKEVKE